MLRCVFARDIATDGTLVSYPEAEDFGAFTLATVRVMSDKISAPGHYLPQLAARIACGPAIVANRMVGSIECPSLRFAMIPAGVRFFAENHVNVILGGSENKTKELYDSLMAVKSEDLSRYLRAVTGNSQCSARELGRLPLVWRQPDIEPGL